MKKNQREPIALALGQWRGGLNDLADMVREARLSEPSSQFVAAFFVVGMVPNASG